ncbi:hypothetical protein J6590_004969 [Homalodisca vitripennis]|nr:hypothetical protein J6590_004969 [Homalodisca vitripennis]
MAWCGPPPLLPHSARLGLQIAETLLESIKVIVWYNIMIVGSAITDTQRTRPPSAHARARTDLRNNETLPRHCISSYSDDISGDMPEDRPGLHRSASEENNLRQEYSYHRKHDLADSHELCLFPYASSEVLKQ